MLAKLHLALRFAHPLVAATNTNSLLRMTGPPAGEAELIPLVIRLGRGEVVLRVERIVAEGPPAARTPAKRLVPDLVTIETTACPCPYSVEKELRSTLTSWTLSIGGFKRHVVEAQRPHIHTIDGVVGGAIAPAFDGHELIPGDGWTA